MYFTLLVNLFNNGLCSLCNMSDNIIFGDEMNIKYDKIGIRLAKRRKELKYTQPQLAEIVGISKNHISQFENGGSVSLEVLLDLCEALKITPDYLLLGTIRDTPSEDFIELIKLCDDYEISVLYDTAKSLISNRMNR